MNCIVGAGEIGITNDSYTLLQNKSKHGVGFDLLVDPREKLGVLLNRQPYMIIAMLPRPNRQNEVDLLLLTKNGVGWIVDWLDYWDPAVCP